MTSGLVPKGLGARLDRSEQSAARALIWRILEEVPAHLVEAALFGSRARGRARPDSDLDILFVFASLPYDREPHASIAEQIAREVASTTRVPLSVWSISLADCQPGARTPVLVDALEDAIPIWCYPEPLPPLSFHPVDAMRCSDALLERVNEGAEVFDTRISQGDFRGAAYRARDDLVRLCTALLLLRGVTRPRRGDAVRAVREIVDFLPPLLLTALEWAELSFGRARPPDDLLPLPGGLRTMAEAIDFLRVRTVEDARQVAFVPRAG